MLIIGTCLQQIEGCLLIPACATFLRTSFFLLAFHALRPQTDRLALLKRLWHSILQEVRRVQTPPERGEELRNEAREGRLEIGL